APVAPQPSAQPVPAAAGGARSARQPTHFGRARVAEPVDAEIVQPVRRVLSGYQAPYQPVREVAAYDPRSNEQGEFDEDAGTGIDVASPPNPDTAYSAADALAAARATRPDSGAQLSAAATS